MTSLGSGLPGAGAHSDPRADGHVLFSGDHRLEGILDLPRGVDERGVAGGVVVAHPHPLYGGTMAQPVVYRVAKACAERGLATLRFNFRGVGRSKGGYSGADEYRDIEAAAAFLRGRLREDAGIGGLSAAHSAARGRGEVPPLALAGYSFGSVMTALAASGAVPVQALALIAFVVDWIDLPPRTLEALGAFRGPVLALCGEQDDLAPPDLVERTLGRLGLQYRLSVVEGAGHLFEGRQREVGERVAGFLAAALSSGRLPASPSG